MALEFKKYDQRNYTTMNVEDGYSIWAKSYDAGFDDALDMILLKRLKSVDWTQVRLAVDLACGTGRTGQWLISKGVQLLDGVDLTPAMLSQAEKKKIYRQIKNEDFRKTSLLPNEYDLAVNSLAAEHIPDLLPLYKEAFRLLRPGGCFLLLGYHPHFQLRGIPTHFDEQESEKSIAISNHIHLVSDFVKAGFNSQMTLMELDEYVVAEDWASHSKGMLKHLGHPISFAGVWQKPTQHRNSS